MAVAIYYVVASLRMRDIAVLKLYQYNLMNEISNQKLSRQSDDNW